MQRSPRGIVTRSLAAVALVAFYAFSIVGVSSLSVGVQSAQARARGGRGGRGGGFRGRGVFRGRGRGIWLGLPYVDDGCYWSPARGRWICPHYYAPYPYYW
jgi:hypothetical protein